MLILIYYIYERVHTMKKLIAMIVSALMLLPSSGANAEYLYTQSTTEKVAGGITYEQRSILSDSGWIRAYIAYVDLSNPNTAVKVLTSSEGSSYLSTVQKMAYDNNTSIAINGDFFNFSSTQTNMLGMVYQNGELISTPALDNQASFVLIDSNQVIMDYFSFTATVTSPQGYSCPIYQINKIPVDTGAITMLTDKWASKTWGANNMTEIIVENNVVTRINEPGSGAIQMPENGYVLTANPEINGFLNNFSVGDEVSIDISINPDISGIREATGGNTVIVDSGRIAKFTGNVTGYAQRSSVGISKDGKTLILVATDGRKSDFKGLTQEGLAELMISLGAHKAINLDGGGSTTFIKKDSAGNQQAVNSVASLRNVSTAIGVVDNKLTGVMATDGILSSSSDTVYVGDSVNLKATFYDEYGNEFKLDPSQIKYSDSDGNILENGTYSPQNAGMHTVYAQCGEIIVSKDIEAVSEFFSLGTDKSDFELSTGEKTQLSAFAYTVHGKKFPISSHCINWTSSNSAVGVQNGLVTAYGEESAVITAELNGISISVAVNKSKSGIRAPLPVCAQDPLYGSLQSEKNVAVTGHIPKGTTLFNIFFSHKRLDNLKNYSHSFLMDNYYTDVNPENSSTVASFSTREYDSTTFITFDNSGGPITPDIFRNIKNIANSGQKNIVLITKKPLSELEKDGDAIKSILTTCVLAGKNVFSVSGATVTGVNFEEGIRYLTAGTVAQYKVATYESDAQYCSYILFHINGDDIKYEFINDL